jgi:hypothetical protein
MSDRQQAEELLALFASAAAAGDEKDEEDDLAPKVETGDQRHFFVGFTRKGQGVWLWPDDARDFAVDLIRVADEADEMNDQHRSEP